MRCTFYNCQHVSHTSIRLELLELSGHVIVHLTPCIRLLSNVPARAGPRCSARFTYLSMCASRQAAKMLHVEPQQGQVSSSTAQPVPRAHPSVAALLSWQHAQLLAALPKR